MGDGGRNRLQAYAETLAIFCRIRILSREQREIVCAVCRGFGRSVVNFFLEIVLKDIITQFFTNTD